MPASHCRQASTTRRRQLRRRAPACPLAEKKFRDCVRFRHRTSANAQKCANFFASCGGHDARDASRGASPRRVASRHRDTTCMHVADTSRHTRLPSPSSHHVANASSRCRCTVASTGTARRGSRLVPVRTAPSRISEVRSARPVATARASPTRVAPPGCAASAPRRKTGADRRSGRMHWSPPDATNTMRSRRARRRPHMAFAATPATRVPG
ncbi:hypothetical protein GGR71_000482 [Xanthomonas sp. F1]